MPRQQEFLPWGPSAAKGDGPLAEYPVTVRQSYPVVGMFLWENVLHLLVPDDFGGPLFAPAGLFAPGAWKLPSHWFFGLFSGIRASGNDIWEDPYGAAWGYEEFVLNAGHASDLANRVPEALRTFERRVAEARAVAADG